MQTSLPFVEMKIAPLAMGSEHNLCRVKDKKKMKVGGGWMDGCRRKKKKKKKVLC